MQSKTKIFASFLLVFSLLFAFFLISSPKEASAVSTGCISECVPTSCVATSCGSSVGTKVVRVYEEVCDQGCPTVKFSAERYVCPAGQYNKESQSHPNYCYKGNHPNWPGDYKAMVKETFGPIDVQYGTRSQDPNKCHRPNVVNLDVPVWARGEYSRELSEHLPFIDANCRDVFVGCDTVACNDAEIVPCAVCPTECGYEGGVVVDGLGHETECPATNSCSTHRWCFPTDSEESPTGYLAEAISIDVTPEVGMPWEPGKMIDKYCAYTPAGTCATQCGYAGGDKVADGLGGYITCQATAACVVDSGDVLGVSTTAEVKGTTTVVLAATAGGDRSTVYLIQSLLLVVTGMSLIYVGREYLNRYQ